MTVIDEQGRPEPPEDGDEATTLLAFLDYQRATLAWKTAGLDAAGLAATIHPTTMTLGGLLMHLAWVEDWWFSQVLESAAPAAEWADVDWSADHDWEWHAAAERAPDELRSLWSAKVEASRAATDRALAGPAGLATRAERGNRGTPGPTLRWIVVHMIEEYARHNGHADLLREAVDGLVGE